MDNFNGENLAIKFITARPGLNTTEAMWELMFKNPEGMTVKELSDRLNRPVSMIQICLKSLISAKRVYVRFSGNKKLYYPLNQGIGNPASLYNKRKESKNS